MIFRQFLSTTTGRASYLIGCGSMGICAVVVRGARRLAAVTRAPVFVHEAAPREFPHVPVADGEEHDVGRVRLSVLHTPGHTLDSVSIVVTDRTRTSEPWFVLSGAPCSRAAWDTRSSRAETPPSPSASSSTTAFTASF